MSRRRMIQNNLMMIGYVFRCAPAFAWTTVVTSLLIAVDNVVGSALVPMALFNALAERMPYAHFLRLLLGFGLLLAMRYGLRAYQEEALKPRAKVALASSMQGMLRDKAMRLDLSRYDDPNFYDDFVFAMSQADARAMAVFETAFQAVSSLLAALGFAGFIVTVDAFVFLPAMLSLALSLGVQARRVRLRHACQAEANPLERRRDYAGRVFSLASYAKELRLTGIAGPILERFSKACADLRTLRVRYGKRLIRLSLLENLLLEVGVLNVGVYGYLAWALLVSRSMSVGGLMSLAASAENITWRMGGFASLASQFAEHALYAERFRRFLAWENAIQSGKETPCELWTVRFERVSFGYDPDKPLLRDLCFSIRAGEKVALVGENGAGKTTLIKLLLRLYDVQGGCIRIGERDLRDLDLDAYRGRIGAVFQDFQLYAATLAENVMMDDVSVLPRQVRSALARSGLDGLPLESPLTREFEEDGVLLSGGQAQKVALARGFYRDCPFLILDEPSAALDPLSEAAFNRSLLAMAANKTVLLISHRLSTTALADRILVLAEGRIAEAGSHAELLRRKGLYARMWAAQARQYIPETE
ncbi:MAG TPA: ABC transporter ATP-binding protein [Clostridia bacterium]|nr:ABC transporter ATP-binding protein [Clostridia bacterium]